MRVCACAQEKAYKGCERMEGSGRTCSVSISSVADFRRLCDSSSSFTSTLRFLEGECSAVTTVSVADVVTLSTGFSFFRCLFWKGVPINKQKRSALISKIHQRIIAVLILSPLVPPSSIYLGPPRLLAFQLGCQTQQHLRLHL